MKTLTMKFGGTSVGSPEAIRKVVGIVQAALDEGNRVIVIVSAMNGVTNALIESVNLATNGNKWGFLTLSDELRDKHIEAINRLSSPGAARERVLGEVNTLLDEHRELCQAIAILGEATPRIRDAVVAFGERLSSRVVAAAMRQQGVNATAYDAGEFLITDSVFQNASPIWDETEARIRQRLMPLVEQGITPIITGFFGVTREGNYAILGRGASDFSAAIFAAYSGSDELIIWTDVDGVMTTDPRIDNRARVLPYVSYHEVGELAFYGAKVLHPKTVQPILNKGMPLRVRNTFNPSHPGTLIGPESRPSSTIVKAVTSVRNVSMLVVSGKGMIGVPGIAGRTFLATAKAGASILMISQSSSEQSFCFVVVDDRAEAAKESIEAELAAEIERQNVDRVDVWQDIAIVTVVGAAMRGTPGVAGRVFTVTGENRINVLAIAQGSSECSISFVVGEADLERVVRAIHELALETAAVGEGVSRLGG